MAEQIVRSGKAAIETYLYRYPQLTLPIASGMSTSEEYKDIALRGKLPADVSNPFHGTEEDCIYRIAAPTGEAEVLYLADRADFEGFVQALAYKCEPVEIPASMGAIHIGGVNNWRKIQTHKKAYLAEGHLDWSAEFKRFTADKENYKDTVILVSKGNYSALPACETPYAEEEWLRYSLTIRIYHELTHLVCRKLYPEKIDAVWDEIVADCMGIYKAIGHYDAALAAKLLGVEGDSYRPGGRLENYVEGQIKPAAVQENVKNMICEIAKVAEKNESAAFWMLLEKIQQL